MALDDGSAVMRVHGILFDIDGTLIDSNDVHADCWIEGFAHFGMKLDWSAVRQQIAKAQIVLASSSNLEEVEYYTDLLGVGDLIEGSTSKEDAEFSKPSPETFEVALESAGTDPELTLVIGSAAASSATS